MFIIFMFAACGELTTVLPSGGRTYYRVNAMVNRIPLDEYSIIKKDDEIRPYFINSVANDPDILGLTVFIQTPSGVTVSPKVQYTLKAEEEKAVPGLFPMPEPAPLPEDNPEINVPEGTETQMPGTETPEETSLSPVPEEAPPDSVPAAPEPPAQEEPVPQAAEPEPAPAEGEAPEEGTVLAEAPEPESPLSEREESAEAEAPEGGEALPAEDAPEEETLAAEEAAEEPPPPAEKTPVIPVEEEIIIRVTDLDGRLPAFPIPESLEIGQYVMVFQVAGTEDILYKIEFPFCFLRDASFALDDIHSYLPDNNPGAYLVPPGIKVMLGAQIDSDPRLDPYIIWYGNRKRIGEGRLADSANYLLWEAPEQAGFQSIRVEVYPFRPIPQVKGLIKELSLPISKKYESRGYFAQTGEQYNLWYRFGGSLGDEKNPLDTRKALNPLENRQPNWLPWAGVYGVSVGPGDIYQIPDAPFVLNDGEQGTGRIRLRLKLIREGTIFTSSFRRSRRDVSRSFLDMNLAYRDKALIFTVYADSQTLEERITIKGRETEDFISPFIDFDLRGDRVTFQMGIENTGIVGAKKTIIPDNPLGGTGTFQLGERTSPLYNAANRRVVFILDELAIRFNTGPAADENPGLDEEEDAAAEAGIPNTI